MTDFLTGLALVFVIEGLFLALFPKRLREILILIEKSPSEALRIGGLAAASLGVLGVWLLRG
jgi:hypothetical protein